MPRTQRGPAVEMTVKVRFPLPDFDPAYVEFGMESVDDVIREQLEDIKRDPSFLADMLAGDSTEADYSYTYDPEDVDDAWGTAYLFAHDEPLDGVEVER